MPSRSIATTFPGTSCIESARYGFVHGPSPAVAEVVIDGQPAIQVGQLHSIQIDQSLFVGYVTNINYDYDNYSTSIRMVDWRDRMRDVYIFGAWNMSDESGLWYHIEQDNWDTQTKTYINKRVLEAVALQQLINNPNALLADDLVFFKDKFKTSWIILKELCDQFNIQLVADEEVQDRLKTTFPDSVDANQGLYLIDVIEYVVSKSACQFACYGVNTMLITLRGKAMAGMAGLVEQSLANPCSTGATNVQVGQELNENGRRVRLLGDQNQYEWIFACAADWNQVWKWGFTFNDPEYTALLKAMALTGHDPVSKMPAAYHDASYWPIDDFEERQAGNVLSRLTRNNLTIEEYRQKIPYKVYRVNPERGLKDLRGLADIGKPFDPTVANIGDKFQWNLLSKSRLLRTQEFAHPAFGGGPIDGPSFFQYDPTVLHLSKEEIRAIQDDIANGGAGNSPPREVLQSFNYPIAQSLLTNTSKQFTCYATSYDIPEGWQNPFSKQLCLVPLESGVSLQIEEMQPSEENGERKWIVRLVFSTPQMFVDQNLPFVHPAKYKPDWVACRLSLTREIYEYVKGELGLNLRVREKKVQVRNLFKGFSSGNELPTIRQMNNRDGMVRDQIAKTDDVADMIAKRMLSNHPVTISGGMRFEDRAGMTPDGLVDSVSVEFTDQGGIAEQINFTTAANTNDAFVGPSRVRVQDSEKMRNELIMDRNKAIHDMALKTKDGIIKAMAIAELGLRQWGGYIGGVIADKAYGRDGVVNAAIPVQVLTDEALVNPRAVLPANGNL